MQVGDVMREILEGWASVAVGLCGHYRLMDLAARVLDGQEANEDTVALRAGLF